MNAAFDMFAQLLTVVMMAAPTLVGFFALQFAVLLVSNRKRKAPLAIAGLMWRAAAGVLFGSLVGFAALWATMVVPSWVTGDYEGLPWLMMFLAFPVGGVAALLASYFFARWLLRRTPDGAAAQPAAARA
ncbi:hypothetical protein [Lysobacter antibioticus]|uniref:hypothetical protein n=1 Tax=Lysobacter antibioticus TaxID=84531 RepID=UPI0003468B5C|nr:hypothetical protein [Lysobacter antibioticus]